MPSFNQNYQLQKMNFTKILQSFQNLFHQYFQFLILQTYSKVYWANYQKQEQIKLKVLILTKLNQSKLIFKHHLKVKNSFIQNSFKKPLLVFIIKHLFLTDFFFLL